MVTVRGQRTVCRSCPKTSSATSLEASGFASVDCNDEDASISPSAEEVPGDGIDSNCDGAELCYTDYDGDGFRPDEYSEVPGDLLCTGLGLVGADAGDRRLRR